MYQHLSRRYRPQNFNSVCGQKEIVTTLKNAIRLNKVAPVYLFCGSKGTGKTTLARVFAKALNCHQLSENQEPCNACPSCLDIVQGKSLDLIEIDGASNRGIDDVRQINETIGYSTSGSKYKIYIIDEVHMLTREAFNAFLKTLEETPANVKFLFATTEPHKVLPTILSRCQRFDLARLTPKEICQKLKFIMDDLKLEIEEAALELISHVSEGGLRDAESILDQLVCFSSEKVTYEATLGLLGMTPRRLYFKLDEAIQKSLLPISFELANDVFATGKDFSLFVEGLLDHFRTHLLYVLKLPIDTPLSTDEIDHYQKMQSFYTRDHLIYILDYLTGWIKEISRLPFKRITLETILIHLIRSHKRVSVASLIQRIEQLHSKEKGPQSTFQKEMVPSALCEEKVPPPPPPVPDAPNPTVNITPIPANQIKNSPLSPEPKHVESSRQHQSYYDTILRFAAVELEGFLKKE